MVYSEPPRFLPIFREDIKSGKGAAHERSRVVFSVTSGAPVGACLIVSAMDSLKAMDSASSGMSMVEAFGADNLARYDKLLAETVIGGENTLFEINPKLRNPPKEFIAAAPDFWAPKPKPAAAEPTSTQ